MSEKYRNALEICSKMKKNNVSNIHKQGNFRFKFDLELQDQFNFPHFQYWQSKAWKIYVQKVNNDLYTLKVKIHKMVIK